MESFFTELSLVIILAFAVAYFMYRIKQPMIVGYILAGVIAGPVFLGVLGSAEGYASFARIGIALLLFIVGMHLNYKLVKEVGGVALIAGFGQIVLTGLLGWLISFVLGYSFVQAVLIAIALTFSSTIIVVKLLTDKNGMQKLFGKISIGLLLVQDLVAVVVLIVLSSTMSAGGADWTTFLFNFLIFGGGAIVATIIAIKFVLPKLVKNVAKSTELMFVFIIAWCLGVSALFEHVGFSIEIGALVAGVALASSPYQHEMSARIKPLRDFFIILFFIFLGFEMIPGGEEVAGLGLSERVPFIIQSIQPILFDAIVLSLFVLLLKPIIALIVVMTLGYSSRTAFLVGAYGSQISEFSIIVALLATEAGIFSSTEVSLITYVALITITASTYLVKYSHGIYQTFEKFLERFEKMRHKHDTEKLHTKPYHYILFGHNRIGYSLLKSIQHELKPYLVIDHNPETIRKLEEEKIPCVYGDAGNIGFVSEIEMRNVHLVASTIPDIDVSSMLLKHVKAMNPKTAVILTADHLQEALDLYEMGADYVILPHFLGGKYVARFIGKYKKDRKIFTEEQKQHLKELAERKRFGHEHPFDET